ncbi:hypothetical protein [Amnibacterium setariae]|uniref:DNA modification methylase n=1 Tax=Amnibacterium setariae TaxID=2306585 RepID=A0A3A1U662_9MICO|nr:hypothetical protein [Amnibacterium setariae]RIX30498.1 hypothetical protein D1781_03475 [Amnibacterium setariae]
MKMRVAASVAVTVLATTVLAGCQFITPQQTARSYTPSDGVNGSVGNVEIRNVFLIDGAEDTASLIGVLTNSGSSAETVTLQWTGAQGAETKQVTVPGGGLLSMSTDSATPSASVPGAGTAVILEDVQATPGGLFPITFSASSKDEDLRVPVLINSFSQYATLAPTPTPTPTKTRRTPLPTDSASAGATDGAEPTPTPTDTLAG